MRYKIEEIEGIGPSNAAKLGRAKIASTADLLHRCASQKGRQEISRATGIRASKLLKWANMADLMRISGVGQEYSELLEAAGVDTTKELCTRRADALAEKMRAVNSRKKLVRVTPGVTRARSWIEQAKKLKPLITH